MDSVKLTAFIFTMPAWHFLGPVGVLPCPFWESVPAQEYHTHLQSLLPVVSP